jgi:hypothetical protein
MGHKETCKAVTSGVILNELLCNCKTKAKTKARKNLVMLNEVHLQIYVRPGLTGREVNTINKIVAKQLKWAAEYIGSKFASQESGREVMIVITE